MDSFDQISEQRIPEPWNSRYVRSAVIEEIERGVDVWYVTIVYRLRYYEGGPERAAQTVRLVVAPQTRIQDEEGVRLRPWDLREGMIISARFQRQMTWTFPPQAEAYEITVREYPSEELVNEGRIVEVDVPNRYIITVEGNRFSSAIRFNMLPNTRFIGPGGERIELDDLFPGIRVRVRHARFMTASIPPQTNAFVVQVVR